MSTVDKPALSGSSSHSTAGDNSYPSSSSATEATHSSSSGSEDTSSDDHSGSSSSSHSRSHSRSHSGSSSSSASSESSNASSRSHDDDSKEDDDDDGTTPRKLPRLEGADTPQRRTSDDAIGRPIFPIGTSASIFPAPPVSSTSPHPSAPPPRYGPVFPPPPPFRDYAAPPPPPLPTLSAAAKDLTEMDVRAGVRLGVYRAPTRLSREQVMDEVESVRMTSSVERVLLESAAQQAGQPGVPVEEKEYAWATVFFADAEAAELCVARMCQPGRRSKWSRLCIQRLPVASHATLPLTTDEEQRYRVHAYQLESSAAATPGTSAMTTSALPDAVLARAACGWCVLSTAALFPTLGLATYLKLRRSGDFSSVDVCALFDANAAQDKCNAGGQCGGLHLRDHEQWKLLLPVVLPVKRTTGTSPHLKPSSNGAAPAPVAESQWLTARHDDCLVVRPLPSDIDESGFVYMFRGCAGFLRAQTVRTVDQARYGVVQFADAASALAARQQATANTNLPVCLFKEVMASLAVQAKSARDTDNAGGGEAMRLSTPGRDGAAETVEGAGSNGASASVSTGAGPGGLGEAAVTHAPEVPFPPLPEGWEYGLSRRTMQYFFLQSGKKSTTWKHPTTQEQYKAKR